MKERCKRCHRKLKTPESVEIGFGSACYKKIFGKPLKRISSSKHHANYQDRTEEQQEIDGQISLFDEESEV